MRALSSFSGLDRPAVRAPAPAPAATSRALHLLTRCRAEAPHVTIHTMTNTFRRIRSALSDLVAEDRPSFQRIDASSARYDDGSWLEARR